MFERNIEDYYTDHDEFWKNLSIVEQEFADCMKELRKLKDPTFLDPQQVEKEIKSRKRMLGLTSGLYTTEGLVRRAASEDEKKEVEKFEKRTGFKVYPIIETSYIWRYIELAVYPGD